MTMKACPTLCVLSPFCDCLSFKLSSDIRHATGLKELLITVNFNVSNTDGSFTMADLNSI